jgi:hypothetical protein
MNEIIIYGMLGLIILLLGWIKIDQSQQWKRLYSHFHTIDCNNSECSVRRTGDVIVPHESA